MPAIKMECLAFLSSIVLAKQPSLQIDYQFFPFLQILDFITFGIYPKFHGLLK
jgi:hypothetical protein